MQESALKQSASRKSPNKLVMHPEHGLLIPVHARIKGRTVMRAYDRDMRPVVMRTPSGKPIGPIEGVQNDNLITDLGMDGIGLYDPFSTSVTSADYRSFLAVGTGTAEPDVADTALANEAQRASSSGSFSSPNNVGELDTDNDVWRATSTVVRVVQMNEDRNLTEFGLGRATGNLLHIRELIRDVNGDPIPVSLLNEMYFRCDHSLVIEIDAPENGYTETLNIEEYDAGNQLENTIPVEVQWGLRAGTNVNVVDSAAAEDTTSGFPSFVMARWVPAERNALRRVSGPVNYERIANLSADVTNNPFSAANDISVPYIPGSYERIKRAQFSAGEENGLWYGYTLGRVSNRTPSGANGASLHVRFITPATYTKLNTTTLRVGSISTWGRA